METPFVCLCRGKQKGSGYPLGETYNKKDAQKSPEDVSDDEPISSLLVYASLSLSSSPTMNYRILLYPNAICTKEKPEQDALYAYIAEANKILMSYDL